MKKDKKNKRKKRPYTQEQTFYFRSTLKHKKSGNNPPLTQGVKETFCLVNMRNTPWSNKKKKQTMLIWPTFNSNWKIKTLIYLLSSNLIKTMGQGHPEEA